MQPMKSYTLTQMKDKYIGKLGTAERDNYEYELKMEISEKTSSALLGTNHKKSSFKS